MSDYFACVAGRLASLAGHFLGWRPDEFWNATPAELATILVPLGETSPPGVDRADLQRLMEQENA